MKKNNRGRRYCFFIITACILLMCFILSSCSDILYLLGIENGIEQSEPIEEPVGGDWRTWRSYSGDYVLNENMTVCFSSLDSGNGYGVYDSSYGGRIGTLILPEVLSPDDIKDGFEIEDYNGDGLNDVGITTNDGEILRYLYISDDIGTWSENAGGCFTYIDEYTEEEMN